MIKLKLIDQKSLPNDDEYLWRYFDIHKFIHLLKQKRFRFTRMDQFEDPLEGIPFETLRRCTRINNEPSLNLANVILEPDKFFLNKRLKVTGRIDNIIQIQSNHFVSCWFYEKRESMAMWNLYSNEDGVAIKIPFGKLKSFLKPDYKETEISDYFCGKVKYQDFKNENPYSSNSLSEIGKVSLRKDISFSHEKEIRFVIKLGKTKNLDSGINSCNIDLKNIDLNIVCHPRMVGWKKKNISKMLKDAKLSKSFHESEIVLRF